MTLEKAKELLSITSELTKETLTEKYRKKAKLYHSDTLISQGYTEDDIKSFFTPKMQSINEARDILANFLDGKTEKQPKVQETKQDTPKTEVSQFGQVEIIIDNPFSNDILDYITCGLMSDKENIIIFENNSWVNSQVPVGNYRITCICNLPDYNIILKDKHIKVVADQKVKVLLKIEKDLSPIKYGEVYIALRTPLPDDETKKVWKNDNLMQMIYETANGNIGEYLWLNTTCILKSNNKEILIKHPNWRTKVPVGNYEVICKSLSKYVDISILEGNNITIEKNALPSKIVLKLNYNI